MARKPTATATATGATAPIAASTTPTSPINVSLNDGLRLANASLAFAAAGQSMADTIAEMIRKYGASNSEIQDYCICGYTIYRLQREGDPRFSDVWTGETFEIEAKHMKLAYSIRQLPNAKSQEASKRTTTEEAAIQAGRMAYSRALSLTGIQSHNAAKASKKRAPRMSALAEAPTSAETEAPRLILAKPEIKPDAEKSDVIEALHRYATRLSKAIMDAANPYAGLSDVQPLLALATEFHLKACKLSESAKG